tara:strand:+ start:114378 stop:115148 length:771 start_codon:yes stop_codon:yes gene_type:complete
MSSIVLILVMLGQSGSSQASTQSVEPEKDTRSFYLIGNSLTWDTVPAWMDGDVQWHVDCGKSLPFIHANPEEPCVKSSTLWPKALAEKQYDVVSLQSHYGATLEEDVATISKWVDMQSRADFVIHTGWAHHEKRAVEYASKDVSQKMVHSPKYIDTLLDRLRKKYPGRNFRQTHAIDLLAKIAADIEAGKAPFKSVSDLHRDAIHVKIDTGRYLMHNCMRHALGQPRSAAHYEKLDPKIKAYLDSVLATLPELSDR